MRRLRAYFLLGQVAKVGIFQRTLNQQPQRSATLMQAGQASNQNSWPPCPRRTEQALEIGMPDTFRNGFYTAGYFINYHSVLPRLDDFFIVACCKIAWKQIGDLALRIGEVAAIT